MVTARARAVAVLGGACLASALLPSLIVAPGAAVELDDTSSTIVTTDQVGSSDVVDAPADDQGSSGNGDEPRPAPEPTPAPPAPTAPNAVEPSEPTAAPDDASAAPQETAAPTAEPTATAGPSATATPSGGPTATAPIGRTTKIESATTGGGKAPAGVSSTAPAAGGAQPAQTPTASQTVLAQAPATDSLSGLLAYTGAGLGLGLAGLCLLFMGAVALWRSRYENDPVG